ncbi:helix-turn-helix transcriptional regulator [Paenibacillus thalictri]|uniref:CBS domain-containing protein n=1 Tax=Paenibacillus thalictri TaxID=2527873 RepID=A0A4Q9DC95_9BACL|nr:helix-turn-helix transcriptional regulator [Paenibacillus thalictri]TBL67907.1 CBS domain-containing protein [Paenibacillus thalictri]
MQIIQLVKQHAPVTGEQIAEMLGLSRPTLRSDLALLVMLGLVDAKPKVGYFLGTEMASGGQASQRLNGLKIKDVQAMPVIVRETTSVHDAVVTLFLENVGSLIVADDDGYLSGVISRKDLLKFTLGNPSASTMPVSLVMTRQPNIIYVQPEEAILDAARKMIHHQVDSLPVVTVAKNGKQEVVGRITKTTMTKVLLDIAAES